MLAIDSSKFFHTDRIQMSSPKLFSLTRAWFQVSIEKKKKAYGKKWQKETIELKTTAVIQDSEQSFLEFYLGFISPWCKKKCIQKTSRTALESVFPSEAQ